MFLLVTAVLALAIVVFHYTSQERIERTVEISSLDRLFDLSGSVENSLLQIFNLYSDARAIIEQNPDGTTNVSIIEKISNVKEDWGKEFEEEVENFEIFVEEQDENVELDIEVITDKELPLTISPHNITYSRDWGIGHVVLRVVPQTLNFNSYYVLVDTGPKEIESLSAPGIHKDSFYFGIRVIDNYGNDFSGQYQIDPEKESKFIVTLVDGHIIKATVSGNELEIWTNSDTPITITTTIDNLEKSDEKVRIGYLKGAINVTFPNLGVSKIGSILID